MGCNQRRKKNVETRGGASGRVQPTTEEKSGNQVVKAVGCNPSVATNGVQPTTEEKMETRLNSLNYK